MKSVYLRLLALALLVLTMGASIAWICHMTFRASIAGSTLPIQVITQINAVDILAVLIGIAIAVVVVSVIVAIGAALMAIRDILEEIRK